MQRVQLQSGQSDRLQIYVKEVTEGQNFSSERKPQFQKAYARCITDRVCTYTGCSTIGCVPIVFLQIHVQFSYRLITRKLYLLDTGQWYRLIQLYNSISHSDRLTVVPSFYLYFRVVGWGKDRWLQPPSVCSQRTQGVVASWLQPENWGFGDSIRLQPEKLGGWSLLLAVARKQRKLVLPMNVILQDT